MMSRRSFEEFIGRLELVQREFPDDSEIVLKRSADRMIRALKENSPDSGSEHKGKLNKSWRKEIEGYGKKYTCKIIYSTAPTIFTLIDLWP